MGGDAPFPWHPQGHLTAARALATSESTGRAHNVCPSDKEEFGIVVLEAMDAGLPVAATRGAAESRTTSTTGSTACSWTPHPSPH
ncbi:glycosyltransferase family 4 protein [Streptomyces sp. NPDC002602]|uniref:glycosyltransferase family 4 protein n=1 Tax=Streptomyces sp. NPDC002602 TaxID=3364654 RepID=UPI0036BF7559